MITLELDQRAWRRRELSYFQEGRISHISLNVYWQLICNAFEAWDRDQMMCAIDAKFQPPQNEYMNQQKTTQLNRQARGNRNRNTQNKHFDVRHTTNRNTQYWSPEEERSRNANNQLHGHNLHGNISHY